MTGQLQRLAAAGIRLVPLEGLETHVLLERGGFAALVERKADGFGAAGSVGLLTEKGFAVLLWRGDNALFVAKGFEQPAGPNQIASLRRFDSELRAALKEPA